MRRLHRIILPLAFALGIAKPVLGQGDCFVPYPPMCTVPDHVTLTGTQAATPDPAGMVEVVVRGSCKTPLSNSVVVFDLSACTDARICDLGIAGQLVSCPDRTIRAVTNAFGVARVSLVGAAFNPGGAPGAGPPCVRVYADGFWLKDMTLAILDQNGSIPGLEATDLASLLADLGVGQYVARSDYDRDGYIGITDFVRLLQYLGVGASVHGCDPGTLCP